MIKQRYLIIKILNRKKIDILIYHLYSLTEIKSLNKLKNIKTIFYNNSCFLIWIYYKMFSFFETIYKAYKDSKYIISLIPFEHAYLFKKWGIKSILMNNFITYDYNYVIPSDLSLKLILMIGRASDKMKRFNLGIEAMKYIIKSVSGTEMKIISESDNDLEILIKNYYLENYVKFIGYISTPEIYFKNASLHIFPSVSESFGLALCETKIYGIPNILLGLDYVSISKGGTIIIYEDDPIIIAKEAIKILKDHKYRKKLGKEARKSMRKFKNELLIKKWIKLLLSVYKENNLTLFFEEKKQIISSEKAINILKMQIKLLRKRMPELGIIKIENIENFTFMMHELQKHNS